MSLAINTITPEGIVLAADSRQTYRNQKGAARIGSDSASKIFLINERVGVAVTGLAFIPEDGVSKNISKFIDQFKRDENTKDLSVKAVADKLYDLFNSKLNWLEQLEKLENKIKSDLTKQGAIDIEIKKENHRIIFTFKDKTGSIQHGVGVVEGVTFFVTGYNINKTSELYIVQVPGETTIRRDSTKKGMEYGASWIGQTDVVARIIKGFDPRIFNIPFVNASLNSTGQLEVEKQLNKLEYAINWGAMPLQDAIDFSVLVIQTTSAIQRFSDGIQADPGDIPGVGGPVDVLVLTPDEVKWIKKKELVIKSN